MPTKTMGQNFGNEVLSDLPLELRFILTSLRPLFSEAESHDTRPTPGEEINWEAFLHTAYQHRVIPFLHTNDAYLRANGCPESVLRRLGQGSMRNALRNGAMTGELLRLSDIFQQSNIPMVAIKGIPQAILLYGGIQYRSPSDIDVLVAPESMAIAHHALCNAGYAPQSRYSGSSFIQFIRKRVVKDCGYIDSKGNLVELHSRLSFFRSVLNVDFDTILNDSQVVRVASQDIRTLSDEHTVLFLLFHGALHSWHCLFWLCDAAQILHRFGGLNWSSLMADASQLGVSRSITAGLLLSNLLLGTPLPDEVRICTENDSAVLQLVKYFARQLAASDGRDSLSSRFNELFYWCKLGASLRYKAEVMVTSPVTSGLIATCWDSVMNLRRLGHERIAD